MCGGWHMLQVREIRGVCPDLTIEEAECALKQCNDRCSTSLAGMLHDINAHTAAA